MAKRPDAERILDEAVAKAAGLARSDLARSHAVHTDPLALPTAEVLPLPAAMTQRPRADKSPAEWAYDRLLLYIRNFESQLDADHEVAMGFAGSDAGLLQIEGLGFFEPDILTFYGRDGEGVKTQLVQHVSQLNFLLRAIPKPSQEAPARRIGFRLETGWQGGDAGDASV